MQLGFWTQETPLFVFFFSSILMFIFVTSSQALDSLWAEDCINTRASKKPWVRSVESLEADVSVQFRLITNHSYIEILIKASENVSDQANSYGTWPDSQRSVSSNGSNIIILNSLVDAYEAESVLAKFNDLGYMQRTKNRTPRRSLVMLKPHLAMSLSSYSHTVKRS